MAAESVPKLLGSQPGLWTQEDSQMVIAAFKHAQSVGDVTASNLDVYCKSKGKKYCIMSIAGIVDGMSYDNITFGYAVWGYNNKWWMFIITSEKPTNNEKKYNPKEQGNNIICAAWPGAYITHSPRREAYQQFSVEAIRGSNTKRGDLKIKVHNALELKNDGNFASVQIADKCLKTKEVTSSKNPIWNAIFTFGNFRPVIGKIGMISVYKSSLMGEKFIGCAEFELPIVFNRQEKITLDITHPKNEYLSGIVVLEQCVVQSRE